MPKTLTPDSPRLVIMRSGKVNLEKISLIDVFGMLQLMQKVIFKISSLQNILECQLIVFYMSTIMSLNFKIFSPIYFSFVTCI